MTAKDTPTPRTDALVEANRGKPCSQSVDCEFARTLERDLAECRAALRAIAEYWNGSRNDSAMFDALTHIDTVARAILQTGEGEGK